MHMTVEFDRQVDNLCKKGYPEAADTTESAFRTLLESLRIHLNRFEIHALDIENGYIPFVIVITSSVVPSEEMMSKVEKDGKQGITKLYPHGTIDFGVIESVHLPNTQAYLLLDIDRGKDTLNVTPADAMTRIVSHNRSPLTIDEGIAITTHFPEYLMKNNCYSLLSSRHSGDKRVPAIWINANKNPNLGWCWEGNPHTWLGSASCASRMG